MFGFGWFWKKDKNEPKVEQTPKFESHADRPQQISPPKPWVNRARPIPPSSYGTCKHCRTTVNSNQSHYCPSTNTQYDSSNQGDFLF